MNVIANNNTNDTNVSDVYEEYVTTDMKVSFKYTEFGYEQVEIDENGLQSVLYVSCYS